MNINNIAAILKANARTHFQLAQEYRNETFEARANGDSKLAARQALYGVEQQAKAEAFEEAAKLLLEQAELIDDEAADRAAADHDAMIAQQEEDAAAFWETEEITY